MAPSKEAMEAARNVVTSWLSEAKPATEGTALDAVYRDVLTRLIDPIAAMCCVSKFGHEWTCAANFR